MRVFPDREALAHAIAECFVLACRKALDEGTHFAVALTGDEIAADAYGLLAREPFRDYIDWDAVDVFWCDERCVPSDDPRSNVTRARELLLDRVPIPRSQIYPMFCHDSPEESARAYESLLREFFEDGPNLFDLTLLTVGVDGSCAALRPGDRDALEAQDWVTHVSGDDGGSITLTPTTLCRSDRIIFVACDGDRGEALDKVLSGKDKASPVGRIAKAGARCAWFADQPAATRLSRRSLSFLA